MTTPAKGPQRALPEATLGSRRFPDAPACLHCGAPIRTTNYSIGPKVEHYDPDASFNDSVWWHCRLSVATHPEDQGVWNGGH